MDVHDVLADAVKKAGNQTAFAKQHGMSLAYVNDVIKKRAEPGQKILDALSLEKVVTYRRKAKANA